MAHLPAVFGGVAADLGLDRIKLADAREHLGGQRRLRRDEELVERPTHMRPAERQPHQGVRTIACQPLEPGIPIDLQHAAEPGQVSGRTLAAAILGVDVGHRWIGGPTPSCSDPPAGCQRS